MIAFKVIVLDYDGTLFDTRPAIIHCIQRAFEQAHRSVPSLDAIAAAVRTGATLPDTLLLLDSGLQHDDAALDALVDGYRKLYRDEGTALLRVFPGAAAALRQLHLGGAKCLVVSNKGVEAIRHSLDEAGFSPLIEFVLGDQPGGRKKPDPAIVTELILPRYEQLRSDEILIVGDTEVDILLAKQAGVSSCWASYGYGEPERCRALAPEHEISVFGELPAIVFGARSASAGHLAS